MLARGQAHGVAEGGVGLLLQLDLGEHRRLNAPLSLRICWASDLADERRERFGCLALRVDVARLKAGRQPRADGRRVRRQILRPVELPVALGVEEGDGDRCPVDRPQTPARQ